MFVSTGLVAIKKLVETLIRKVKKIIISLKDQLELKLGKKKYVILKKEIDFIPSNSCAKVKNENKI